MIRPLLCSRVVVSTLVLSLSGFVHNGAVFAQDISGGANVLLASADVEAKLGKGIFSSPQNRVHAPKRMEKKVVARSAHSSRQTSANNRPVAGGPGETRHSAGDNTKPPRDHARRVPGAADFNKQGDEFFDAGQYQKAVDAYQTTVKMRPNYPEAYLNLGEAFFNLGRYDDATTAEKQAIQQKPDWAPAYRALGNAYLKLDRTAE